MRGNAYAVTLDQTSGPFPFGLAGILHIQPRERALGYEMSKRARSNIKAE